MATWGALSRACRKGASGAHRFRITAAQRRRRGPAFDLRGLRVEPTFGQSAPSAEEFPGRARAEVIGRGGVLAPVHGTSNLLALRTGLMGTAACWHCTRDSAGPPLAFFSAWWTL